MPVQLSGLEARWALPLIAREWREMQVLYDCKCHFAGPLPIPTVTEGAAYCCTKVEHPRALNHSCCTATTTEPRSTLSKTPVQAKDSENVDNWWRWRLLTDGGGDYISSRCDGRR